MGLEIYLELNKDTSKLPLNLQRLFEFLRTGLASDDAQDYLKEAAEMMKRINFSPEERKLADNHRYQQMKRASEDAYQREQGREENKIETVKNGLENSVPIETISALTGLSTSEIETIRD